MTPGSLSQLFSWAAITFSILAALSTGLALHFRTLSSKAQNDEINRLKPRNITDTQKSALKKRLAETKGTVGFISRLMDGEGRDFAQELAGVFTEAGWTVHSIAGNSLNDFPGYIVGVVSEESLLPQLNFVRTALNESGIDCRLEEIKPNSIGGGFLTGVIWLVVGRKK
jgi:hypothetical protein